MKVGIVTFYKTTNYGAMLQAWSLISFLRLQGHSPYIVRQRHGVLGRESLWKVFVPRRNIHVIKSVCAKLGAYLSYRITEFANRFPMDNLQSDYDALIVGSDQMWNPRWVTKRPDAPGIVFLDFAPKGCRRLAYAVSFAVSDWGDVMKPEMTRSLLQFSAIGVREVSGKRIVDEAVGRDAAHVVVDPTLLWTKTFFDEIASALPGMRCPYLFSYHIAGNISREDERTLSRMTATTLGVGRWYDDKNWFAGVGVKVSVSEWIGRLKGASYVLTNSFHALVFAILYHRPFAVLLWERESIGMNERIYTLLDLIGCRDKCFTFQDREQAVGCLKGQYDWTAIDRKISAARDESQRFLQEILK